ncbi:DUF2441 domain-containing protein [Neobacillus sp. 179-C4.2 HS]|uniref:DUF2441 domain-containing protein n=1 Tax=Neobacillus driksii TaxID=3035913 RepID=A0ABV4YP03_9BACI|nr:DUF2441 domain-containing protein [Neobacillus sp. 179.-C4.2 HS]MDP5197180.1 DUF2441 domain-containing protein [Neobacillus sp. 179.-C4.2 HS]
MTYFYHINKNASEEWKLGAKFSFGHEPNYLWNTFYNNDSIFKSNFGNYPYDQIINHALEVYRGNCPKQLPDYHFRPIDTIEEALGSLYDSLRNCREMVFEDIRKEKFTHLPSRKSCIWLLSDDKNALEYWKNTLSGNNLKVFRVKLLNGNTHRASQKWLEGGTFSLSTWENHAINYWSGIDTGNIDDEILCQGEIEIVEVF